MPWFMSSIKRGFFEVTNPYNRRVSHVPASTDQVGAIVFWSKNFGPFLANDWGRQLAAEGYHLFFNFTLNAAHPVLEPGVPPLLNRLNQLKELNRQYGPEAVTWRLDPICWYRSAQDGVKTNLMDLDRLIDAAAGCGTRRCVTSFLDIYKKVKRRAASSGGIRFIDPPLSEKVTVLLDLEKRLSARNISLQTCCETEVSDMLPVESTITPSACISNSLLMSLYGGRLSLQKDRGQRIKSGCGCHVSADIGSYDHHPCYHNCLFCYANPCAPAE
jgi:hypothetical protein